MISFSLLNTFTVTRDQAGNKLAHPALLLNTLTWEQDLNSDTDPLNQNKILRLFRIGKIQL